MSRSEELLKMLEVQGANEGHYLDRLLAIMGEFHILPDYVELLTSVQKFTANNPTPKWVHDLVFKASELVIAILQDKKITEDQWRSIAWGLDHEALKDAGLLKYRRKVS